MTSFLTITSPKPSPFTTTPVALTETFYFLSVRMTSSFIGTYFVRTPASDERLAAEKVAKPPVVAGVPTTEESSMPFRMPLNPFHSTRTGHLQSGFFSVACP